MVLKQDFVGRHVGCELRNGALEISGPVMNEMLFRPDEPLSQ